MHLSTNVLILVTVLAIATAVTNAKPIPMPGE